MNNIDGINAVIARLHVVDPCYGTIGKTWS